MRTKLAVTVSALTLLAGHALAQPFPGSVTIDLQPVATGLVSPITGTHANDNRFFIVDQTGKILILQNGAILPTPFLDLAATGDLAPLNAGYDEKGLLGLIFHPNYAANGRFFVRYSKQRTGVAADPCFGTPRGCHEEILAEHANCDGSTATPVLTANDFQCFLNRFASGDPGANCDLSAIAPILTANDFQCFLNKYAAGCP